MRPKISPVYNTVGEMCPLAPHALEYMGAMCPLAHPVGKYSYPHVYGLVLFGEYCGKTCLWIPPGGKLMDVSY